MSTALVVLPMVWATAQVRKVVEHKAVTASLAFYRKYTEALLRRYAHMAMESGRVPSLLGRELFRGRVTNYAVHGFDDVVIFVHDMERCLEKLALARTARGLSRGVDRGFLRIPLIQLEIIFIAKLQNSFAAIAILER